jgi:hypothetical protein
MSDNSALLQQANKTEGLTDQSTAVVMGPRIPVKGRCLARLVSYIELGTHAQDPYQGQEKPPALEVQLVFECFGKDNIDEIEVDGVKKKVGRVVRPFPMAVKLSERATFMKQFKLLDYGRKLTHLSQMLNDVYYVTIEHKEAKSSKKPYAIITNISAPIVDKFDEDGNVVGTEDKTEKCPPASRLQMFMVEKPTFEQWSSINIDGTYTKKTKDEDGKETEEEVSKNFIQEKIMDSLDWDGSAMSVLLNGLGEEEAPADPKSVAGVVVEKTPDTSKTEKTSVADAVETPTAEEDPLAELGLA